MDLKDLYRDVIVDHNRQPRNFGRLASATREADGHNALCGDRLHLSLQLDGDRIGDIRFDGEGCAISTASASLMTEAVKGKRIDEAHQLFHQLHDVLMNHAAPVPPTLGKLAALTGVRDFPARVKCASLCWHTLEAALADDGATAAPVSTE